MPAAYLAMRDKFHRQGMGMSAAKGKAARIYNATHDKPVTRGYDKKHSRRKSHTPRILSYGKKK